MLLAVISVLPAIVCNAEIVTSYERVSAPQTEFGAHWTATEAGYWITGFHYHWFSGEDDALFQWHYGRPSDAVTTNIQSQETFDYSTTTKGNGDSFTNNDRVCDIFSSAAMYSLESYRDGTDRLFAITCINFPPQFTRTACRWLPENELIGDMINNVGDGRSFDFECGDAPYGGNPGVLTGFQSSYHSSIHFRRFRFRCCDVDYNPIETIQNANDQYVVGGIESSYDGDGGRRNIAMTRFRKPIWYDNDIIDSHYALSNVDADVNNWVRICPMNGAFRSITADDDGTFSFECAQFVNDISMSNCIWSGFLNEFHSDFTKECDKDGVIRGIQSYYSAQSTDYRFKIYCCEFSDESFIKNTDISITVKTHSESGSGSQGVVTFDLCWNNHLYQGIKILNNINQQYTVDILELDSCGNNRIITVSMDHTDNVRIESIGVEDNGIQYTVESFGAAADFSLAKGSTVIEFPDDFLTQCKGSDGCNGIIYNLEDFQQYLITISPCVSFEPPQATESNGQCRLPGGDMAENHDIIVTFFDVTAAECKQKLIDGYNSNRHNDNGEYSETSNNCWIRQNNGYTGNGKDGYKCFAIDIPEAEMPNLGVVLRGLNGNLDKQIVKGPIFDEVFVGKGNIGDLIHVNIEYESGGDFCIESVTIHDPYNGAQQFAKDYFGDGTVLSNDCGNDRYFKLLSNIQYVPCYEQPFSITTYETSLYCSIQIHSCDGADGGITAAKSSLLSLTITGISKDDSFVSSSALSLQSSTIWAPGESRDYTLQLSGDFEKVSLVSITNNEDDALCVDSVLINGEDAFLTHYWVGSTDDHDSLQTIPAILEWPICDVELTTTITAKSKDPTDPDSVLTATCLNRNRLLSVDCAISQTFETYEETSWQQEIGEEVTKDITMESGTSTEMSSSVTAGVSGEVQSGVQDPVSGTTALATMGFSFEAEFGSSREWSSSVSSSNGISNIDITTDGKVNGETISIECNGAVSVPPSQKVQYSLLVERTEATLSTLTDMKMTKCSKYLYNKDVNDPDDYIYIYGIKGELKAKEATNCYVEFSQSEQVNPEDIKCGEERALAAREWGTFVPQCDPVDPGVYMGCQCAYGDSLTHPTCGCVDPTSGNLMDVTEASVVAETETYKWRDWCIAHCGADSVSPLNDGEAAAKVAPRIVEHDVADRDVLIHLIDNLGAIGYWMVGLFVVITLIYGLNSSVACCQKCVSKTNIAYYETEAEKV